MPGPTFASPADARRRAEALVGVNDRARLADQIQVRAYQVVPYINGGQWKQFTAVRTNVSGLAETTRSTGR